ncbi:MAG: hypothetical protein RBT63_05450, partial [Bdellovibrionales bacterium]|nr:hypothetical protein [Bdellovibrionales bacterium]
MKNSYLLKIATIALTLTTLSHAAHASNERGNGGDVVRCSGKLRTLDSVVLKSESLQYFNYFELTNYKDSLRMIQTKLEETLPYYGVSLRKFLETYEAKADLNSSVFWIQGKVLDIKDENLFIELPKTCGSPIQAVVLANHPITRYYYNKGLLDELAGNGDEMSWLLIHEWLRPYIKDTDTLRILNGYFHSNQVLESTEKEIQMKLKRFRFECCSRATASEVKQDQAEESRYTPV